MQSRVSVITSNDLVINLILLCGLVIAGCCPPEVIPPPPLLPNVATPALPKIQESELMCLSDDAYKKLVERDARLKAALKECQSIIRSTH